MASEKQHSSGRVLDWDTWQEVWNSLARNRLRAFLTACGVFWGILMLTLLLGFGTGLERGVEKNFMGLVRNSVFLAGERTLLAHDGLGPGRLVRLMNEDLAVLRSLPDVEVLTPRLNFGGWSEGQNVVAGSKTGNFYMSATTPSFISVEPLALRAGRFLNDQDLSQERKVVVIGQSVSPVLFGDTEPIGQYLSYRGVFFQVIGVVQSQRNGPPADRANNTILLPLSTGQRAYNQPGQVGFIAVAMKETSDVEALEKSFVSLLKKRHHVHPEDPQAIRSFNLAREYKRISNLFLGIRVFVWFVGIATLLAGVIGVSNILLITVKERTKELGIRKALGATPGSILRLIVMESLMLTSVSGYLGIITGVGLLELASRITRKLPDAPISEPAIDLSVVLIAGVILLVAGVLAALMPAHHAVRVHPVEALRAE